MIQERVALFLDLWTRMQTAEDELYRRYLLILKCFHLICSFHYGTIPLIASSLELIFLMRINPLSAACN